MLLPAVLAAGAKAEAEARREVRAATIFMVRLEWVRCNCVCPMYVYIEKMRCKVDQNLVLETVLESEEKLLALARWLR